MVTISVIMIVITKSDHNMNLDKLHMFIVCDYYLNIIILTHIIIEEDSTKLILI